MTCYQIGAVLEIMPGGRIGVGWWTWLNSTQETNDNLDKSVQEYTATHNNNDSIEIAGAISIPGGFVITC